MDEADFAENRRMGVECLELLFEGEGIVVNRIGGRYVDDYY